MKTTKKLISSLLFIAIIAIVSTIAFGCSESNGPNGDDSDTTDPNIPDTAEASRPDSTAAGILQYFGVYNIISNGVSQGIAMKDDILYIGDGQQIRALDVSNPESPSQLAVFPTTSSEYITGMTIDGNLLYAVFQDKLRIFDITSAISPTEIGTLSLGGNARDIDVFGDYLFVGRYSDGICAIDAHDPTSPAIIDTWFSYPTYSLAVGAGGLLYAGPESNFRVFQLNVYQPESLYQVTFTYPDGETAFDMEYIYGHLFVASGKTDFASNTGIFNIQSRNNLVDVYSDTTDYVCKAVAVEGNCAYVIDANLSGESNLYFYYAYNPAAAFRADNVVLTDEAASIYAKNDYIYVLCKNSLLIYKRNIIS